MKRHFYDKDSVVAAFTVCGLFRHVLDVKAETTSKQHVTCGNCKSVLKAREVPEKRKK